MREQRRVRVEALHDYPVVSLHGYAWPAPPRASFGRLAWSLLARAFALIGGR